MPNERDEEDAPTIGARSRVDEGLAIEGEKAAGEDAEGVLTLVCFKCGREYFFTDEQPPSGMSCDKCGNTVFRDFFTAVDDEAAMDFQDSTARDLDPDDAEGDTLPGDLIDLDRE